MTYICPKGHSSTDKDYCSECGVKIENTPSSVVAVNIFDTEAKLQDKCPECGLKHTSNMRFCEMCGHDYEGIPKSMNEPANSLILLDNLIAETSCVAVTSNYTVGVIDQSNNISNLVPNNLNIPVQFQVIITADKNLYIEDVDNPFPENAPQRIFHLDLDENLVGRTNKTKNVNPEIPLNDAGVSHRHMKFLKNYNGVWEALEMGSSNGTKMNGVDMEVGVPMTIKTGDEFTLGMWTRIVVKNR